MDMVKTSHGRDVPAMIRGKKSKPFKDHKDLRGGSKLSSSITEAIHKVGLKDGMTISFHHQLREGDYVINMVLETIANMGIKNIRLASTALFKVNQPVVDHIKKGVVNRIEGSMNGPVGSYISYNPDALAEPAILRSHGRRGAALALGELPVDVAFVAASQSDDYGNCNGIWGKSAFGPMAYSYGDTRYAKRVVVITDDLQKYPNVKQEITEDFVDRVVQVDSIGDPDKIVSGTLAMTTEPDRLRIAKETVDFLDAVGVIRDGLNFQGGAGGMSLAATKYLGDRILEKGVVADMCIGGTTKYLFDIYDAGGVKMIYIGQAFDRASIDFCRAHPEGDGWTTLSMPHYASPFSKSRGVDHLDVVFLGGTEVDVDFNVNVNTHSDGQLLHGIGGHQDTAAGAKITIILTPITRKTNPIIRDRVTTITTPGDVVDVVATDYGMAVNPCRKDLLKLLEGKDLPLVPIEELRDKAYELTGRPKPINVDKSKVVGYIHWLDGTVIDTVFKVNKEEGS
ncbi:MAG: citrate lyase subunit alpha [Candidatus Thermoplasmatota archaeon]|nr:citrate lyase subunit alpha [Candidatus Thermoplasmatota archaeon]